MCRSEEVSVFSGMSVTFATVPTQPHPKFNLSTVWGDFAEEISEVHTDSETIMTWRDIDPTARLKWQQLVNFAGVSWLWRDNADAGGALQFRSSENFLILVRFRLSNRALIQRARESFQIFQKKCRSVTSQHKPQPVLTCVRLSRATFRCLLQVPHGSKSDFPVKCTAKPMQRCKDNALDTFTKADCT